MGIRLYHVVVATLLVGCAITADGPRFQAAAPSADRATVYIYRPYTQFNFGGYPEIFVNSEKKFALKVKGYGVLTLPPGEYEIKAEGSRWATNWWPRPAARPISVEAGREYYIRVIPVLPPGVNPGSLNPFNDDNDSRTLITLIPKELALPEITELQLLPQ